MDIRDKLGNPLFTKFPHILTGGSSLDNTPLVKARNRVLQTGDFEGDVIYRDLPPETVRVSGKGRVVGYSCSLQLEKSSHNKLKRSVDSCWDMTLRLSKIHWIKRAERLSLTLTLT